MNITDQIKYSFQSFKHPVTVELHTEDFDRIQAVAEKEVEKAGITIVADSRYLEHSTHNQGRVICYMGLTIKEKINDNMQARMNFAETMKREIGSTVGITKERLGSEAPDLGSENGRWYTNKEQDKI